MKKVFAYVILIIGVLLLVIGSCLFNIYAAPHTLMFCVGLFIGFFYLVISKKKNIIFWVIAGITSILVSITSMFIVSFIPDKFEMMDLRVFFNPVITFLTSLFFFMSVYLANHFVSKAENWSVFKFLFVVVPLGTAFSTVGSIARIASDAFYQDTSVSFIEVASDLFSMLLVFFPQGLIFSLVLFSLFVVFAKLYGFPEKIELDLQK